MDMMPWRLLPSFLAVAGFLSGSMRAGETPAGKMPPDKSPEIGALAMQLWGLPPVLREPIRWHHDPLAAPTYPREAAIVYVANLLSHRYASTEARTPELAALEGPGLQTPDTRPATKEELFGFLDHLEGELDAAGFFKTADKKPGMLRNIRNLFSRAALTEQEVRSLRGIVASLNSSSEVTAHAAIGAVIGLDGVAFAAFDGADERAGQHHLPRLQRQPLRRESCGRKRVRAALSSNLPSCLINRQLLTRRLPPCGFPRLPTGPMAPPSR